MTKFSRAEDQRILLRIPMVAEDHQLLHQVEDFLRLLHRDILVISGRSQSHRSSGNGRGRSHSSK